MCFSETMKSWSAIWAAYIFIGAALLFVGSAGIAFADNNDSFEIEKIKPVSRFDADEIDYKEAVEKKFDLKGTLDAVYDDRVVIGDTSFALKDSDKISGINVGDYVGVDLDQNGNVLLIDRIQSSD